MIRHGERMVMYSTHVLARHRGVLYAPPMSVTQWVWVAVQEHDDTWIVSRVGDSACVIRPTCVEGMSAQECRERAETIALALNRIYRFSSLDP
jgi:hypothetical protein